MDVSCPAGVKHRDGLVVKTVEMHTGGEPLRIIVSGYPPVMGVTLLDKRRYVQQKLDYLRTSLMHEPRGHKDMYGALLLEKDIEEADIAVLFLDNKGYSTMCGHGVIALGRYAVDYKLVKPVSPETPIKIQCPCGLVPVHVQYDSETGQTGYVRFQSVPSFAFAINQKTTIDGYVGVSYDIGYGGGFYALVDVQQFKLDLTTTDKQTLCDLADRITQAVKKDVTLSHPDNADLAFLYGTILTDGCDTENTADNICVFADRQIDRSPCGSGTTARVAVQFHKKQIKLGQDKLFRQPKVGSEMKAKVVRTQVYDRYDDAVVVEVTGHAYYSGRAEFWLEEGDRLAEGFLVR